MRNRIRLFGGKETEIFHLDNQVGAIAFIPVLNVIYYLVTLVTARGRRFALFLETVLLLAIGSLLIRLSTGWLLSAVFAHVLTCIGIGIQQQLLDTTVKATAIPTTSLSPVSGTETSSPAVSPSLSRDETSSSVSEMT